MRRGWLVAVVAVCGGLSGPGSAAATPTVISAFFGVDNGLPAAATLLCPPALLLDGMPVVFRDEIDQRTVWPSYFTVTTRSGARRTPLCATTAPANQESEDRTVLLIGQLGDDPADPPVRVDVTGPLRDEAGRNLAGASVAVIALSAGPELVYAEPAPAEPENFTYTPLTPFVLGLLQTATACPAGTVQRVRVTWDGGVTAPGGTDSGEAQRLAYTVTYAGGTTGPPAALADLGDMDNNHLLCLTTGALPVGVSAAGGFFADPRGDVNPATSVALSPG